MSEWKSAEEGSAMPWRRVIFVVSAGLRRILVRSCFMGVIPLEKGEVLARLLVRLLCFDLRGCEI